MPQVMYCEDQSCACNCEGFCEYAFGIAIDSDRKCKAYIARNEKEKEQSEVSDNDSNG